MGSIGTECRAGRLTEAVGVADAADNGAGWPKSRQMMAEAMQRRPLLRMGCRTGDDVTQCGRKHFPGSAVTSPPATVSSALPLKACLLPIAPKPAGTIGDGALQWKG